MHPHPPFTDPRRTDISCVLLSHAIRSPHRNSHRSFHPLCYHLLRKTYVAAPTRVGRSITNRSKSSVKQVSRIGISRRNIPYPIFLPNILTQYSYPILLPNNKTQRRLQHRGRKWEQIIDRRAKTPVRLKYLPHEVQD